MSRNWLGGIVAVIVTGFMGLAIWVGTSWPVVTLLSMGYLFAGLMIDPAVFQPIVDRLALFGSIFGKKSQP